MDGRTSQHGGIVSLPVSIADGGTGASTPNDGFNNLAPSQAGNGGKFLTTDGMNTSWATVTGFTDQAAQDAVGGILTDTSTINFTYDSMGHTISADIVTGSITDSLISNTAGINATKIANGSVNNTEFQYLDGVTSSIQTQIDSKINLSEKGANNGVATLDGGGKVPISQLPTSILVYRGIWDASTNTPTLMNGTGTTGDVYITSVAGSVDFGAGAISFAVGDWAIYNGTQWQKSINSNSVVSVNGQQGIVVLTTTDIAEGTNLYFTNERAQDAVGTILTDTATIDFTYNDAGNQITADVKDASITLAKFQNIASGTILGRNTAGTGSVEVLTTIPNAVQDNITRLGTIVNGVWNGTKISEVYGGTNQSSYVLGDILYASAINTLSKLAGNTTTTRNFLRQVGDGANSAAPAWDTVTKTDVGLSNVENTALSTWAGSTNITTLGTITTGTWNATVIGPVYGGTGLSSVTQGDLLYGSATNVWSALAKNTTATRYLANTGTNNNPQWDQINLSNGVTGVLSAPNGGTGQSTYVVGDLLYASATNTLSRLADIATGNALISGGVGVAPSWGKIGLTTHVSGILPIANGGTNSSTTLNNNRVMISSGGAIVEHSALTQNQIVYPNASGLPTGDSNFTWNPSTQVFTANGVIYSSGTTGSTPTSGAGTRLMWIPAKFAFRAGSLVNQGTAWDAANIGNYSAAFGLDTKATGLAAFAAGNTSFANGDYSVAMGNVNTASGTYGVAFGSGNTASGNNSTVFGQAMTVSGTGSFGINLNNTTRTLSQNNTLSIMGGNVGIGTLTPGSELDVNGTLRLSGSTSGYVGLKGAAAAGSTTYTLPSADGTADQALTTNGTATLSWKTLSVDVQAFVSNGTWTKPANAKHVEVICIGGGGGGGSGRLGGTPQYCGGSGGGGGGYSRGFFAAAGLSSTVTVTVGAKGVGGAAQTTTFTDGNAGTAGGDSSFGSYIRAGGGGQGLGGILSGSISGGTGGIGQYSGGAGGIAGGFPGQPGSPSVLGGSGGGGGGGTDGSFVSSAGGAGGALDYYGDNSAATGGSLYGGNGGTGYTAGATTYTNGGGGGGGGAGHTTATGGRGGDGGKYGGGGGGGGSANNSTGSSGRGGDGGDGLVLVITFF